MGEIRTLELHTSSIKIGDIVAIGKTRHLLTRTDDNPCIACSLDDLCDTLQTFGRIAICNEAEDSTFIDITPH